MTRCANRDRCAAANGISIRSPRDTAIQKNSKSSGYEARAGNQCRRVAELLPYIATGNARNESAESHRRIEVAVRGSFVSIFNETREMRALHTVSKCRESSDKQKSYN
jgi:hypothetical protein